MSAAGVLLLRGLLAMAPGPEPPPADEVTWIAPADCPGREALLAGIAARRGRELEPGLVRVLARTTVVGPRRYRLELELDVRGRRESRALLARTCAALVDGAALLIALAVDGEPAPAAGLPGPTPPPRRPGETTPGPAAQPPSGPAPERAAPPVADSSPEAGAPPPSGPSPAAPAAGSSPEPAAPPRSGSSPAPGIPPASSPAPAAPPRSGSSPAPGIPPGSAPAAPPRSGSSPAPGIPPGSGPAATDLEALDHPAEAAPAPASRRRPGGFVRLHGLGELGALPGPTGGVGLAGGLLWRWLRLELQASYLAPRAVERFQTDVRASLFAAAALGCVRLGDRRRFEFPVCLGLEVGGIPGTADGPSGPRTALGRWAAATVGLGAALRVHPQVALFAFLQGLAAFQRGTFVLTTPGDDLLLFDPGVASGRLALGVELRFGEPW